MIFKRPYAFLIKYFKIINFIIAILAIYIAYRSYGIITFFNDYISSNYTGNFYSGFATNYISPFMFFITIIIILGIAGITLLFVYKKKPNKAYITSLIYYIIFVFFLIFIKNVLVSLEETAINAETARLYRDLSLIALIPQFIFIVLFIIRGFGLNISKFDFQSDIKDLEISEQDNEEIEITIRGDSVKLRRNIRRFFREFLYYIKENKFIFIVICLILTVVIGFIIYKALPEVIDRNYSQGDNFIVDGISYQVADSIITNLNYKGDIINKNNYYVVVKLNVENNTDNEYELDYNIFRLDVSNRYIYPSKDKSINFIDYANEYYGGVLKAHGKYTLSLIYEIENSEIKKHYQIKIANGSAISDNIQIGKFNYINISPIVIDQMIVEGNYQAGDKISLSNSNLGNSFIQVSNPIVTDKYIYDYEYCPTEECYTYKNQVNIDYMTNNKSLVVLDYVYELDKETPFYKFSKDINRFIDSFIKIKYNKNGNELYADVKNVTPSTLKNQMILETTKDIETSPELYLSINIRNKEYLVNLK